MNYKDVSFDPYGLVMNNQRSQLITLKNTYREMIFKKLSLDPDFVFKMRAMQQAPDIESKRAALEEINQDSLEMVTTYMGALIEKLKTYNFETVVSDLDYYSKINLEFRDLLNPSGLIEDNRLNEYKQAVDMFLEQKGNPPITNGDLFAVMQSIGTGMFGETPTNETFIDEYIKKLEIFYGLVLNSFVTGEDISDEDTSYMESIFDQFKQNLTGLVQIMFFNVHKIFKNWFRNFSQMLITWRVQIIDMPKNMAYETIRVQDYVENLERMPSLPKFKDKLINFVGDADRLEYYKNNMYNFKIFSAIIGGRPIIVWYLEKSVEFNQHNLSLEEKIGMEQLTAANECINFSTNVGYLDVQNSLVPQIQEMLKQVLHQNALGNNQPLAIENNPVDVEDLLKKLEEKVNIADQESLNKFNEYYENHKDEFQKDPANAIISLMQIKINEVESKDSQLTQERQALINQLKNFAKDTSIDVDQALEQVGGALDGVQQIAKAITNEHVAKVDAYRESVNESLQENIQLNNNLLTEIETNTNTNKDLLNEIETNTTTKNNLNNDITNLEKQKTDKQTEHDTTKKNLENEIKEVQNRKKKLDDEIYTKYQLEEHRINRIIYQDMPVNKDMELKVFRDLFIKALEKRYPGMKLPDPLDVETNNFLVAGKKVQDWYSYYMNRIDLLLKSKDDNGFSPEGVLSNDPRREKEEQQVTDYVNGLIAKNKFVDLTEFITGVLNSISEEQKKYFTKYVDDPIINKAIFGKRDLDTWYSTYLAQLLSNNK